MTSYQEEWGRIVALHKAGQITANDLIQRAKTHREWFLRQGISDATPLMVNDLKLYADHIEEFGRTA